MRPRQIEVFNAVYSSGSVTRAAKILNVSQPSVSKVLAHAEQQLGYLLFERINRRLIPTPEAHALFSHSEKMEQIIVDISQMAINLATTPLNTIRVACTPSLGIDLIPGAIINFSKNHPNTKFEVATLHHDQISHAIKEMTIDIGIALDPKYDEEIRQKRMMHCKFVVITPTSYDFKKLKVGRNDIKNEPFIKLNPKGPLGEKLEQYFIDNEYNLNFVSTSDTHQVAKTLVAKGMGITIIDEITAKSTSADTVKVWELTPPLTFNVALMHLKSKPLTVIAKKFMNSLLKHN
ncbi:uncharacterized protein METZ01_LOCUS89199 [marine metagenome]|uniref:HTH lysR-type domain-containing protein n=1 Tax=marine metagenome TaxID=408172 RepID=A0A381V7J4_9ZZZZ